MISICLVTCYMGPLPDYFRYFVASCKKNCDIQFIVINDSIIESYSDTNIHFLKLTLADINELASSRLSHPIHLQNSWKINELKPLFGVLFTEYLQSFNFWGWCDLDIIWGNIRNFLTDEVLHHYDVIVPKRNWTAGHFTLFRNNENINNLFRRNDKIFTLLNSPVYLAFEECCHRWDGKFRQIDKLQESNLPISMFDIIKNAEQEGLIKALFKDMIREHPQPIDYLYSDGNFKDLTNNEEFMYYHLITIKKIWRFYIPKYDPVPEYLYINRYGLRDRDENKLIWMAKRALSCYYGIKASVRKQSATVLLKKLVKPAFKLLN